MIQKETISRFEDGGNSDEKSGKDVPVKMKAKASMMKMGGVKDPLRGALGGHPPKIPSEVHEFKHGKTSQPKGALYNPEGEFGVPNGPQTAATSMTLHFNNPGENALAHVMGTIGKRR